MTRLCRPVCPLKMDTVCFRLLQPLRALCRRLGGLSRAIHRALRRELTVAGVRLRLTVRSVRW